MGLGVIAQGIVNGGAAVGRIDRSVERFERIKPQDFARIQRIGIAPQRLDIGDAKPFRHQIAGGCRCGPFDRRGCNQRLVERARPIQIDLTACPHILDGVFARHRYQALQKARAHHRITAALGGPRDHHFGRTETLTEIMGGLADPPFGARQVERLGNRTAQKRIGLRRRRPDRLVTTAQHHAVGLHQARFQQTPDADARMGRTVADHDTACHQGFEIARQILQPTHQGIDTAAADVIDQRLPFTTALRPLEGAAVATHQRCQQGLHRQHHLVQRTLTRPEIRPERAEQPAELLQHGNRLRAVVRRHPLFRLFGIAARACTQTGDIARQIMGGRQAAQGA